MAAVACGQPTVSAVYDGESRLIARLDADADRDGRVESRTYFAGGRPVRIEIDSDGNGTVDRWEYYDESGQMVRLGTSSQRDPIEDTWVVPTADGTRVELSTRRNGVVDRREFRNGDTLVRVEQDTNLDGAIDQWATYRGGIVRELLVDMTFSGRPGNRRLIYGDAGAVRVEQDEDGDGAFEVAGDGGQAP
jgi:hypothetical protein